MNRGKRVFVGYARSTGIEDNRGLTVALQIDNIKAYAHDQGVTLVKIYFDNGIPNQNKSFRAGIFNLLDEIPFLGTTDIVVQQVDRMIREGEIGRQILKELDGLRIGIHSLTEDSSKVKQDTRRITASTVAALKSANTKIRALKRGKAPAGRAPYGFRRESVAGESTTRLVVVPDEAETVKWIFREYLRRRSMAKVASGLAENGVPAPGGKEWSRASVAWILGNEIYIGVVKFGSVKGKGEHEPIVAPIVFHKVQQLRQVNRRVRRDGDDEAATGTALMDSSDDTVFEAPNAARAHPPQRNADDTADFIFEPPPRPTTRPAPRRS